MTDSNDLAEDRTDWAEDRTLLANERTFAAWMRTGMASVAIGIGFNALFRATEPTWLAKLAATFFLLIGIGIIHRARVGACETDNRLRRHEVSSFTTRNFLWTSRALIAAVILSGVILWLL